MKNPLKVLIAGLGLLTLSAFNSEFLAAHAQGTAFTYQGRLNAAGSPASGTYDFRFKLYYDPLGNTQAGNSYLTNGIAVTNGLFITAVDFGPGLFAGSNYWLEVDVMTNGAASYTALSPLQALTPTPYAIFACTASNLSGSLPVAQLSGTVALTQLPTTVVTNNANGLILSGTFTGNGANVTNVNAVTLSGMGAANFWQLGGNNVTSGQIIGSTNNQPVELWVNNARALRLDANGNVIGGSVNNEIDASYSTINGGAGNSIQFYANYSVLGGGLNNSIQPFATYSFIGGGQANLIQTNASTSFIGGGYVNSIQTNAYNSVLGGGYYNSIQPNANNSVLGGGTGNSVQTNSSYCFLGGGEYNSIQPNATNSFLGGGYNNSIQTCTFFSFLGGGAGNFIQTNSAYSFLGGGYQNVIQPNADHSVLSGGDGNSIQTYADHSVVCGGAANSIQTYAGLCFIGGGNQNSIQLDAYNSFLGGGYQNTIQTYAWYSFLGGGAGNFIQTNSSCSVLGGGAGNSILTNADHSFLGGGNGNSIQQNAGNSVLGGGAGNSIRVHASYSFLGGGQNNSIQPGASLSVLGGGLLNFIQTNSAYSVLVGGDGNGIQTNSPYSFLGGGAGNFIQPNASFSVLGGGYNNNVGGQDATIPGGDGNVANGLCSFVAGMNATDVFNGTNCNNSFVWGDGSRQSVAQGSNTFNVLATGGVWIFSGPYPDGVKLPANGTAWVTLSDRNAKKDFAPVDGQAVLEKLAAMPVQQWHYKWEKDTDTPNIGPMAQDFIAAFYPGRDDKGISTLEFDGVELAAIQGLNQKLNEKDAEIQELKARLDKLERLMSSQVGGAQ